MQIYALVFTQIDGNIKYITDVKMVKIIFKRAHYIIYYINYLPKTSIFNSLE